MIVKLRTLTRKSKAGWGMHANLSVHDLLISNRKELLTWYFVMGNITFTNDILDELLIPAEYRIKKPGSLRNKEINGLKAGSIIYKLLSAYNKTQTKEQHISDIIAHRRSKKVKKILSKDHENSLAHGRSKNALQYAGQSHKGLNNIGFIGLDKNREV